MAQSARLPVSTTLSLLALAFVSSCGGGGVPFCGASFVSTRRSKALTFQKTHQLGQNYYMSSTRRRLCRRTKNNSMYSKSSSALTMRDASSANWFKVGDQVRVVDDVMKAGSNLRGRVGIVIETWEKCDVDPTCCCAEQVDLGMAVHVKFQCDETDDKTEQSNLLVGKDYFVHYFAEEELLHVKSSGSSSEHGDEGTGATTGEVKNITEQPSTEAAFDGLSCKEFKLQQLQMGEQAQRIAAFEASKSKHG